MNTTKKILLAIIMIASVTINHVGVRAYDMSMSAKDAISTHERYNVVDIRQIPTDVYNIIKDAHPNASDKFILLEYKYGETYAEQMDTPNNAVAGSAMLVQNYLRDTDFEGQEKMREINETPAFSEPVEDAVPEILEQDQSASASANGKIFPSEQMSKQTQEAAWELSIQYKIPVQILMGIAYTESTYRGGLISPDGHDYGLCQIRDINHGWIQQSIGKDLDYLNDSDSLEAACFMLRHLHDKYSTSSWGYTLLCYNGGEAYAANLASQGIWGSKYTQKVLSKAYELGWTE